LKNGAPTHLSDANSENENLCYMELDTDSNRELLNKALENISIRKIDYNGGMYLITIEESSSFNQVLTALIQHNIEIKYVRNISQSTKRLFI
jgi:ABC-2 type transport system ATP-binding protein